MRRVLLKEARPEGRLQESWVSLAGYFYFVTKCEQEWGHGLKSCRREDFSGNDVGAVVVGRGLNGQSRLLQEMPGLAKVLVFLVRVAGRKVEAVMLLADRIVGDDVPGIDRDDEDCEEVYG